MFSGNVTLRPSSSFIVARITTRERWVFAPYSIPDRGEQDIPLIYLKTARWRTVRGNTGYFVNIPTRPSQYYPVEFNHDFVCWTEVTWNAPQHRWAVERPAGSNYRCDIFEDEVRTAGQVGPIDGQNVPTPRTPAPSTEDEEEERESEGSENTAETGVPGNTTEEEGLADLAESIHINPPEMATMMEPVEIATEGATYLRWEIVEEINPWTDTEHAWPTMKQPCDEHKNQTDLTHQVEDRNNYQSYHPFDSPKTTNLGEDSPEEEDSPEDFPEAEDSPEVEDSPEAEGTREEEEYHREDHQEVVGGHRRYPCRRPNKGN